MLTTKKILSAIRRPGRYHDGFGLNLCVVNRNNVSWQLRYQRNGREHWLGLGPLHTIRLKEARQRARAARLALLDGFDPIEEKQKRRAAAAVTAARTMTFARSAHEYFTANARRWKPKQARRFTRALETYVHPVLGQLPVASIETGEVLRVIEPLWSTRTATANRVRGWVEAVLDWAKVHGLRTGDNPARWTGHLDQVLPSLSAVTQVTHLPALPYGETAAFMSELRAQSGIPARALEFTILTAARTSEVIGAKWSEIDLDNAVWTIPANRMKEGREQRVPLSPQVLTLLQALRREHGNPFVFTGATEGRSVHGMAMVKLLRRMGHNSITVHGFRSTFRDWAAESTNAPNHVVEMALAHAVGTAVERAYRRGELFEKRRKLMQQWGRYCEAVTGDVVALRA